MAHRLLDCVLGHRVEHHPVDPLVLEQLLALEDFVDVPGDRLALAIRVGRQDHPVGVLDRPADVAEALGGLGVDLPTHGEIIVRIDRAVLGRQITHMAERGVDAVVLAEILVDGLRLGRRLDDHDFHSGIFLRRLAARPVAAGRLGAGYGDARAVCQMGGAGQRRCSGRALDVCLREIVALVQERGADSLGLSVGMKQSPRLSRAGCLTSLAVTVESFKREMCGGRARRARL